MNLSIRIRVILFVVAAISAVGLLTTYLHVRTENRVLEHELQARGTIIAESLSKAIDYGMATEDLDFIKEFSDIVHTDDVTMAHVYSTIWLPLYSQPQAMISEPVSAKAREYFDTRLDMYHPYTESNGKWVDIYMPIYYNNLNFAAIAPDQLKRFNIGFVRIRLSTDAVRATERRSIMQSLAVLLVLSIVTIVVIGEVIRRKVMKPVLALHHSVMGYKRGELPTEVLTNGASEDEIVVLSHEFNRMSRAIRERERNLAEEKERLAVTLRSIGDGVITTDTQGRVTLLNGEAEHMTGWSMREAEGRPLQEVFDIVNELSLQKCENPVEKCLRTGEVIELANHTMLISRDGTRRIITDSGAPIRNSGGEVIGVVLVFRDTTEKTHMADALRDSESKFKGFAEQALVGIYLVQDGVLHYVNPRFAEMFGYTVQDCIGKPLSMIAHPNSVQVVDEMVSKRISGELKTVHYEFTGLKRDGSFIQLDVYGSTVTYLGRVAAIGTLLDVTERKRASDALRQSESQYRSLIDNLPIGMHFYELLPDDRLIFTGGNAAADQILGVDNSQYIGKTLLEAFPAHLGTEIPDRFREVALTGRTWSTEQIEYKDNRVSGAFFVLVFQSAKRRIAAVFMEISERKRAEEQIKNALKEKEILLAEVHHRVKNNLAVIYALLQLQTRQIKDPAIASMFKVSQGRIRSLALVHEKLYRSKDMGQVDVADYVNSLVREVVSSFNVKSHHVDVQVEVGDFALSLDHLIPCGLIINELVSNAMKYAFAEVEAPMLRVEIKQDAEGLCTLKISDNGAGFAPDFDMSQSRTLGLQIVRTLTEQLSGKLQVSSGRGAAFSITFNPHRYEKPAS